MASYLDENGLSHLWAKIKLLVQNTYSPSSAIPLMDGTASVGTSIDFARGDHRHPSDATKADKSSTVSTVTFSAANGFEKTINGTTTTVVTTADLKTALGVVDTDFTGATSGASGTHGLVPAPSAGQQALFLRADGSWASPTNTNTTYTLSGAVASHKFTSTLTPSSGTATTSELTLAAGTRITLTDDTANNKITIATTAEVNQNAFSNVAVSGQTTVAADSKTDTLNLAAGSNVTITTNATTDTITIDATDTTYSNATQSSAGLMSATDKTKLDGITAGAEPNRTYTAVTGKPTANQTPSFGGSFTISQISQDATGQITATDRTVTLPSERTYTSFTGNPIANQTPGFGGNFTISQIKQSTTGQVSGASWTVTIPNTVASASANGLMSSADYSKLAGFGQASDYALKTDIGGIYKYKGSVPDPSGLPVNPEEGDVYNIESESIYGPAGTNVAWDGSAWDSLGGLFSITSITNAEIDAICV